MLHVYPTPKPEIRITENDRRTLQSLAFGALSVPEVADELLNELDRAKTISKDEAEKYIGLGSKATFTTSSGDKKTVRLVMPADADISQNKISILTPVGVALLGLSEGQSIDWEARNGRIGTLTVLKLHEASENAS